MTQSRGIAQKSNLLLMREKATVSNKQDGEAFTQQLVVSPNVKVKSGTETKGGARQKGKSLGVTQG